MSAKVQYFRSVGLPVHPSDLGIEMELYLRAVRMGAGLRPGRKTVLDEGGDKEIQALAEALESIAAKGSVAP